MKERVHLLVLLAGCLLGFKSIADVRNAIITWTGDAGYHAQIAMSYDDAFSSVAAWGGGPFAGTPTNHGIQQLSVAFFNPSLQLLFSTNDISNGAINYRFLNISFDTGAKTLLGFLDVGKDSFAEGEPGSSEGQFYLTGVSSPSLHDSFLAQVIDSGGQFTVMVVPEPSTWALCVAATTALFALRRSHRL